MKTEFFTYSTEETEKIAYEFALTLNNGKCEFIAMYGDLGVGKTAFVRGLAKVFSPESRVKSPTFTIVNQYDGGKIPFYHFDVYRIEDDDELYAMGFDDYVQKGICVVEWSENIPDSIPKDAYKVTIERVYGEDNQNLRKITIEKSED
ncbi:MAG: tRNA (adenosine(37)-N6)-threonylcarbamoyltransferase complex ATPase subunit type 1 TsaE [Clostridia bacterium]|nr:tRNA (adenosine(37)-N6)-threonylcarbamoyltransferase complex ATPase subunit type 1 TsaE [Clostridia bacterium]